MKDCYSEYEKNTLKIFKNTISAIKEAGRDDLAQKWQQIINHCRKTPPSEYEEKAGE